jgi:hypothetical protein
MFRGQPQPIIRRAQQLWERSGKRGAVTDYVEDAIREIELERQERVRSESEIPLPFPP